MYKPNLAVCVSKKMEKNEEDTRIKKNGLMLKSLSWLNIMKILGNWWTRAPWTNERWRKITYK